MTGRELIIHILQNNLEDKEVFENGRLLDFITDGEAAAKLGVGVQTIRLWVARDKIPGVIFDTPCYIPANAVSLIKGDTNVKKKIPGVPDNSMYGYICHR